MSESKEDGEFVMEQKTFEQARLNALTKVYLDIAETGKPTQGQLDFISMMKPKQNPMKEAEEAGKFVMSLMGFMEGK